jgi:hypothetical protein
MFLNERIRPRHKKDCKNSKDNLEKNVESFSRVEIKIDDILFQEPSNQKDFNIEMLESQKKTHIKTIIQFFSEGLFEKSLISCKINFTLSKELFRAKFNPSSKNSFVLFNYLSDGLLYVKALIKSDQIYNARGLLKSFLKTFLKYFNEKEVFTSDFLRESSVLNKKQILKKYTNFISTFASLFSAIGDFNNSETLYIKYIKLIEINIGSNSLDASNCYFLIGLFYYENVRF